MRDLDTIGSFVGKIYRKGGNTKLLTFISGTEAVLSVEIDKRIIVSRRGGRTTDLGERISFKELPKRIREHIHLRFGGGDDKGI